MSWGASVCSGNQNYLKGDKQLMKNSVAFPSDIKCCYFKDICYLHVRYKLSR